MRRLLCILMMLCCTGAAAQTGEDESLDSLISLYHKLADSDTAKVSVCNQIAKLHYNVDSTILWGERLKRLAMSQDRSDFLCNAYYYIGWAYFYLDDYTRCYVNYSKAVHVAEAADLQHQLGVAYNAMADYYRCVYDFSQAESYVNRAVMIFRNLGDTVQYVSSLRTLSSLYTGQFIYDLSEQTLLECLHLDSLSCNDNDLEMDLCLMSECKLLQYENNLLYGDSALLADAWRYARTALDLNTGLPADKYLALSFMVSSRIHGLFCENVEISDRAAVLDSVYDMIMQEQELVERMGSSEGAFDVAVNMTNYYSASARHSDARRCLDSLDKWITSDTTSGVYSSQYLIANIYYRMSAGMYSDAIKFYAELVNQKMNQFSPSNAVRYTRQLDQEMLKREIAERDLKQSLMVTRYSAVIILITLVLGVLAVFYYHNRRHHRLLQDKNKNITASIHYASLIQKAVLPADDLMRELFSEYFVVYIPLNIVAGDFYWANRVGGYHILVCADCTGHGVPGAFVSMLGVSLLNELSSDIGPQTTASQVLNRLRDKLMKSLGQDYERFRTGKYTNMDGMDLAIVMIDYNKMRLQYAGANRPLWIVRNGKLISYNPDVMSIGVCLGADRPFRNREVDIADGDMIYMFSDGITDQFGYLDGARRERKHFSSKRLESLLLSVANLPMDQQKVAVETAIENWKNGFRQIDDNILIGVRVISKL